LYDRQWTRGGKLNREALVKIPTLQMAGFLLLAGFSIGSAAPNIPASDLPGRERQRFDGSPVERFMQPTQKTEPLIRWQCDPPKWRTKKQKAKQTEC
jgi:hypothetical protein